MKCSDPHKLCDLQAVGLLLMWVMSLSCNPLMILIIGGLMLMNEPHEPLVGSE
jgi:hypothetical protein